MSSLDRSDTTPEATASQPSHPDDEPTSERRIDGATATDVTAAPSTNESVDTTRSPALTVVVGGGAVGRLLARRLSPDGPVHYVDDDPAAVERAARCHDATYVRELADRDELATIVDPDSHVVVATPRDATNLLVAQHCRSTLGATRVVVVVTDPRTHDVYPPDVERVCATTALTDAVAATLTDVPRASVE